MTRVTCRPVTALTGSEGMELHISEVRPAHRPIDPTSLRQSGHQLRVRIPADLSVRLARYAVAQGVSLGEVVRRLLTEAMR
jgi:predicted HicB family RNase H-like nuclease